MIKLFYLGSGKEKAKYAFDQTIIEIGREEEGKAKDLAVSITEKNVSRDHCRVVRGRYGYSVIDLKSANGTFVNGKRVYESGIKAGDIITLGHGGPSIKVKEIEGKFDSQVTGRSMPFLIFKYVAPVLVVSGALILIKFFIMGKKIAKTDAEVAAMKIQFSKSFGEYETALEDLKKNDKDILNKIHGVIRSQDARYQSLRQAYENMKENYIQPVVDKKTFSDLLKETKPSVGRINARTKNGKISLGTGTCVLNKNNQAYILTARHVVEGNSAALEKLTIKFSNGTVLDNYINIREHPAADVALIVFDSAGKNISCYDVRYPPSVPKEGESIYTLGYPIHGEPIFANGSVSSVRKGGSEIIYNVSTNPGNSGGPVFNAQNELVAIHTGGIVQSGRHIEEALMVEDKGDKKKEEKAGEAKADADIKLQGLNTGITFQKFQNFLNNYLK